MTPDTGSTNIESPTIERGEALFCDEQYEQALEVFRELLSADPNHSAALNNAGITCGAMGHIEASFDYLHAALQADPSCAPAFFNLIDLAISCEAVEAGRKIFMLFEQGIDVSNEKRAFEDMLFSPEADALIKERRLQFTDATPGEQETRMKQLHVINQQTQQLARSAA